MTSHVGVLHQGTSAILFIESHAIINAHQKERITW